MLSKSKNIAKRWEGRSKSHFSHIRNKVEEVLLRPLILGSFWSQNRPNIKKKCPRNHYKNQVNFSSDFLLILVPFSTPRATLKLKIFHQFCSWCHFWAILAPRDCPKCSKTAPEVDFLRILLHFGLNVGRIS